MYPSPPRRSSATLSSRGDADLCRHLREFLATFGDRSPVRFAVAIDMRFWVEPTCVIQRAHVDKGDAGHHGNFQEDWRAAFWTEVALDRLTTIARIMIRLSLSLNGHCRPWNGDQGGEGRSRLLLAILAMAYDNKSRVCSSQIANLATETVSTHFTHFIPLDCVALKHSRAPLCSCLPLKRSSHVPIRRVTYSPLSDRAFPSLL
jgi:hypothetical protein